MELPSRQSLFTRGRDTILTATRLMRRAVIEQRHSDVHLILSACAAMGDEVLGALSRVLALSFMDTCENADLDAFIYNRFGFPRKPASPGFTYVRFLVPAPTLTPTFTVPAGTLVRTETGVQYQTNEAVVHVEGTAQTGLVEARSLLAGSSQQVGIGDLNKVASSVAGAPNNLGVTNPYASVGATEQETDPEFRSRARGYFNSIGRGTKAAIEHAALSYPGVKKATLIEFANELGLPGKYHQLVIADRFTEGLVLAGSIPPTYQAQADILARNVLASLSNVRNSGVPIDVIVASVQLLSVQVQAPYTTAYNISESAVRGRVRGTVTGFVNALGIGQTLDNDALADALRSVPGVYAPGANVLSPVGSVRPSNIQLLRTTTSLVGLS